MIGKMQVNMRLVVLLQSVSSSGPRSNYNNNYDVMITLLQVKDEVDHD